MSDVERRYHENGALHSTASYQNGLLDGPKELLHENGRRICRVMYRHGRVVDGFIPIFGRDGTLIVSEYWEKGTMPRLQPE